MEQKTPLGVQPNWLAGLYLISCAFPVVASFLPAAGRPASLGMADVSIAFLVVISALWMDYRFGKQVTPQQRSEAYALLSKASIVILVIMGAFIYANQFLDWPVLVVGLAWRAWLLIYALPAWLAFRDAK